MFCSNCGKEIEENAKFCSNCGAENIAVSSKQNNENANKKRKKKFNKKIIIIVGIIIALIVGILFLIKKAQKPSIEKMIETADFIQWEVLRKDMDENTARAKEKYENNYYIGEVFISKIEQTFCDVYVKNNIGEYMRSPLKLYLPEEDLIKINQGDRVQIITQIYIGSSVNLSLRGNVIKVFPKEQ